MKKTICEEWRDISGYEGLYQVSNFGNVKSLYRYKKQLKPMISNRGYKRVDLFKDKERHQFFIHRLVAQAFIDNPDNKPEVNHKDENPLNNHADNLEWVTRKENNNYGTRTARQRTHTDYAKRRINNANQILACSKPVAQYLKDGTLVKVWKSASDYCRSEGHPGGIGAVRRCCLGERKSAYGYVFKDVERSDDLLAE